MAFAMMAGSLPVMAFVGARLGVFGRNHIELQDVVGCDHTFEHHMTYRRNDPFMDRVVVMNQSSKDFNRNTPTHSGSELVESVRPIDVTIRNNDDSVKVQYKGWDYRTLF
jgi:hypothetical protein